MKIVHRIFVLGSTLIASLMFNAPTAAEVQEFLNDRDGWEATVGSFDTITFTEYPVNTVITDQYRDEYGIQFDGFSHVFQTVSFVNDGHGLRSPQGVRLIFDQPMTWIGADFPGWLGVHLLADGEIFHTAQLRPPGQGISSAWFRRHRSMRLSFFVRVPTILRSRSSTTCTSARFPRPVRSACLR